MAKKRVKKASRRPGKAKSKRGERSRVDRSTKQLSLFDPKTGKPTREAQRGPKLTPSQLAAIEEREQARQQLRRIENKAWWAARRASLEERKRVGVDRLPREMEAWLLDVGHCGRVGEEIVRELVRRFGEPSLQDRAVRDAIGELVEEWYLRGCLQGYIEGRVELASSRRKVADKRIRRNREQTTVVDGLELDKDERDAAIFAELPVLKREHGAEEAERLLAERHGMSDRRVRQIALEQTVLRELAALVQQGFGEGVAGERVVQKHGVDKDGKPSKSRQASVRNILAKGRLRTLPELP